MRADYINSLVVYYDDTDIEVLRKLYIKLRKKASVVGIKNEFTPEERELIERTDDLFEKEPEKIKSKQNADTD